MARQGGRARQFAKATQAGKLVGQGQQGSRQAMQARRLDKGGRQADKHRKHVG